MLESTKSLFVERQAANAAARKFVTELEAEIVRIQSQMRAASAAAEPARIRYYQLGERQSYLTIGEDESTWYEFRQFDREPVRCSESEHNAYHSELKSAQAAYHEAVVPANALEYTLRARRDLLDRARKHAARAAELARETYVRGADDKRAVDQYARAAGYYTTTHHTGPAPRCHGFTDYHLHAREFDFEGVRVRLELRDAGPSPFRYSYPIYRVLAVTGQDPVCSAETRLAILRKLAQFAGDRAIDKLTVTASGTAYADFYVGPGVRVGDHPATRSQDPGREQVLV